MSRLIEYDQKNEVYRHYQLLDTPFYKRNSTGDLMNRITEDVSRVRMYTGPAMIHGEESNGMLMAARDSGGVVLLRPDRDCEVGAGVK